MTDRHYNYGQTLQWQTLQWRTDTTMTDRHYNDRHYNDGQTLQWRTDTTMTDKHYNDRHHNDGQTLQWQTPQWRTDTTMADIHYNDRHHNDGQTIQWRTDTTMTDTTMTNRETKIYKRLGNKSSRKCHSPFTQQMASTCNVYNKTLSVKYLKTTLQFHDLGLDLKTKWHRNWLLLMETDLNDRSNKHKIFDIFF